MQENWLQLQTAFTIEKNYVLATIAATRGSTYRKKGTLMLVDDQGICTGLLSGGCLEADISLHAQQVLIGGKTKILRYNLQDDAELLWGLGLGCDGEIDILLQPLTGDNQHLGFASLMRAIRNGNSGYFCQNITDNAQPHGQFFQSEINTESSSTLLVDHQQDESSQLIIPVVPPLALLICGAGPDAVPVVNIANQLGWQVSVWDHRNAYLKQKDFQDCYQTQCIRVANADVIALQSFDAAVVMTHNLETDGAYLSLLRSAKVDYIGLLGPIGRRNKLLSSQNIDVNDIQGQVYGPVGLDLGGRSPQAIALSIAAQIQQHISKRYAHQCYQVWQQ